VEEAEIQIIVRSERRRSKRGIFKEDSGILFMKELKIFYE